jgi:hypothetical protein
VSRFRRWLRRSGGRDGAGPATRLDLCPKCGKEFVYPVTWTESGPAAWWLLLAETLSAALRLDLLGADDFR